MKYFPKLAAGLCCGLLLTLPVQAGEMEQRRLKFPLFSQTAVEYSPEELEYFLNLKKGELQGVKLLTSPSKGHLYSFGVEVQQGETLSREELEQLCYLSDGDENDWFAILPICEKNICAMVNLKAMG
jgi:hypothetical protein